MDACGKHKIGKIELAEGVRGDLANKLGTRRVFLRSERELSHLNVAYIAIGGNCDSF